MNAESLNNQDTPRVAVLMSTYNGEKYIREQLDSIFNQKDVDITLFVRDDGSSDNTVAILREYEKNNPMIILEDGENVGPGESFMMLVYKYANEPGIQYYAFADQDDIWLEDKLCTAVDMIKKRETDVPVLYSSNQYLYIDGENKGNRHKELQKTDLVSHMTENTVSGCTFVFNKPLAQMVTDTRRPDPRIINYRLHDAWMMLVTICCGQVIYDETSHILYRIHNDNTVGVDKISFEERLKRLKGLVLKQDICNVRMITARELLELFDISNENDKRVLCMFANYQKSIKDKLALAFDKEISNNCSENRFIFRAKVLLNYV